MIIEQIFTETEVKWYFDSIEEIVIVGLYIRNRLRGTFLLPAPATFYVYVVYVYNSEYARVSPVDIPRAEASFWLYTVASNSCYNTVRTYPAVHPEI